MNQSNMDSSDYQPRQNPPPQPVQQNQLATSTPNVQVKAEVKTNTVVENTTKSVTRKTQPVA